MTTGSSNLLKVAISDIKIVVSIKPRYFTLIYYMRYKAVYTVHTITASTVYIAWPKI